MLFKGESLGTGGFAKVYKALEIRETNSKHCKTIALKVLTTIVDRYLLTTIVDFSCNCIRLFQRDEFNEQIKSNE